MNEGEDGLFYQSSDWLQSVAALLVAKYILHTRLNLFFIHWSYR